MKTRPFFRIACFLLCACLLLSGCGEEIQTPEEETTLITVGFSQVGAESDWRVANTTSMRESLSEENGFEFVRVYALRGFTGTLRPNPAEIDALEIFSRERLDAAVAAEPERFAPSFVAVLRDFFGSGDGR